MQKRDFLTKCTEVIIYGAGHVGKDVLQVLNKYGLIVTCFLDMNVTGMVNGIPVLYPDGTSLQTLQKRDFIVIIAVFNPWVDLTKIFDNLCALGFGNVVSFQEFHKFFSFELGDKYWLTSVDFYQGIEKNFPKGLEVWEDEKSRHIYSMTMQSRLKSEYSLMPFPETVDDAYFPKDIPSRRRPARFVDCGAFTGDTLSSLLSNFGKTEAVAAFEPDPGNFAALSEFVASHDGELANSVILFPCGVWSSTTQLKFTSDGLSSGINGAGDLLVQCISLDEAINSFDPTLIKMDIEGAEYQALLGARKIIHRSLPDLAVCLYHRPEHLWQIPLLIQSWDLGYKFYLRQYCHNGFESVMFALRG